MVEEEPHDLVEALVVQALAVDPEVLLEGEIELFLFDELSGGVWVELVEGSRGVFVDDFDVFGLANV